MHHYLLRMRGSLLWAGVAAIVTGCAVPVPPAQPESHAQVRPACTPVEPVDPLLGNWLSVHSQKGVAGELRTLFTLQADGSMAYTEQLKRPGKPSQGLSETGCWQREGQVLVMRTYESNGSVVDLDDPIYINRYQIISSKDNMLRLKSPDGLSITAKQMSPGYRLPF